VIADSERVTHHAPSHASAVDTTARRTRLATRTHPTPSVDGQPRHPPPTPTPHLAPVDARRGVARRGAICAACVRVSVDGEDAGVGRGVVVEWGAGVGRGLLGARCGMGVGGGRRGWPSTEGVGWVGVASRVRRAGVSTAVRPKLVSYGVRLCVALCTPSRQLFSHAKSRVSQKPLPAALPSLAYVRHHRPFTSPSSGPDVVITCRPDGLEWASWRAS
jgi:hypothetical protein